MQLDEHNRLMFLFLDQNMHEIFTIQVLEPFRHEIWIDFRQRNSRKLSEWNRLRIDNNIYHIYDEVINKQ